MKKMTFSLFVIMLTVFGSTTMSFANKAVFYPATGRVSIPQLVVDGDLQQAVFSVDFQQRNGTWVFDLSNVAYALTAPDKFTGEWLAGKTLYQVWHGNGMLNGTTLESVPVVIELYFSPNGIVVIQGIFNNDVKNGIAQYTVGSTEGRLFIVDGDEFLHHIIVCGSTDRYIKTHSYDYVGFNNVTLFFFDKDDALSAAEFLANDPPMCPTAQ